MSYAIEVSNLLKKFDNKTVVDHVSLSIEKGSICGFLGPNGSGKTTTLRMICGLLEPDGGEGFCLGHHVIHDRFSIKRLTGYMPQKFGLYDDLTVEENLRFVAQIYQIANLNETIDRMIEEMNLTLFRNRLAGELSGGWKQRLSLAACLMHEPQVLLLDEPTAGVDPKARRDFWDKIHELSAKGMTVLVSTHYMDEAERCHEIAYIYYGHLLAKGSTQHIIEEAQLYTYVGEHIPAEIIQALKNTQGLIVAPFGNQLHVCSYQQKLLEQSIQAYKGQHWQSSQASLEDVFIAMMEQQSAEGKAP